ncbi:hypothetical protein HZS_8023 [Henneguya salminicola]|nr:hypothetical protein HZS_8023 [Henneguya salminicola]
MEKINLNRVAEENTSDPKDVINRPKWSEPFPCGCYLEVIQRGIAKPQINLAHNVTKFTLGRSPSADGILDNIMVSKFHIMIVYGKYNTDSKKFWVCDLESQNKTKINKNILKPHIFYPLSHGDVIQLAQNEFTLILSNPNEELKFDLFSKINEPEKIISKKLNIINPIEKIKEYFEKKGLEPEYEIETITENGHQKYMAKLPLLVLYNNRITVYDEDGEEIIVQIISANKNSIKEACAEKALEIIQKYDLLFDEDIETVPQQKRRELIENDYYEDDEDTFYDRSGQSSDK